VLNHNVSTGTLLVLTGCFLTYLRGRSSVHDIKDVHWTTYL